MDKLSDLEIHMIIESLKTQQRELNRMMQDLERHNFYNGNQNVMIQNKMHNLNDLIRKLEGKGLYLISE